MNSDTKKRCIMIFPQFKNINIIDGIREKYDPLSNNVRPHITLVFPFESNISKEDLQDSLIASLQEVKPFKLILGEIIKIDNAVGFFLFLSVNYGSEKIIELHNKLYSGMFKTYKPKWLNEGGFMPHMTIGNFTDRTALSNAYQDVCSIEDRFSILVDKISVEIIDENEDSIIEIEVNLGEKYNEYIFD